MKKTTYNTLIHFILISVMMLTACRSKQMLQQSTSVTNNNLETVEDTIDRHYVKLHIDEMGNSIRIPVVTENGLLPSLAFNSQTKYFIGTLELSRGISLMNSLRIKQRQVPLLDIHIMEAREPISIVVDPKNYGKLAVVSGYFNGGSIYQAKIEVVFDNSAETILFNLLEEGLIDIEKYVK